MAGEVTSGVAAIMGALVGGLASLASTWLGERSRHRRDLLQREIAKRETAYSDFIRPCVQTLRRVGHAQYQ